MTSTHNSSSPQFLTAQAPLSLKNHYGICIHDERKKNHLTKVLIISPTRSLSALITRADEKDKVANIHHISSHATAKNFSLGRAHSGWPRECPLTRSVVVVRGNVTPFASLNHGRAGITLYSKHFI